jgi:hypothetical protein
MVLISVKSFIDADILIIRDTPSDLLLNLKSMSTEKALSVTTLVWLSNSPQHSVNTQLAHTSICIRLLLLPPCVTSHFSSTPTKWRGTFQLQIVLEDTFLIGLECLADLINDIKWKH